MEADRLSPEPQSLPISRSPDPDLHQTCQPCLTVFGMLWMEYNTWKRYQQMTNIFKTICQRRSYSFFKENTIVSTFSKSIIKHR